ncbi:agmatinase, partial [Rhizobium ruizarguesonis]
MANRSIEHSFTATSLTSAASAPTFAGALSFMRRRFTKALTGVAVSVCGIPFDAATPTRPGTR